MARKNCYFFGSLGGRGSWPYSSAGRMISSCTSRPKIELIKCSQNRELT